MIDPEMFLTLSGVCKTVLEGGVSMRKWWASRLTERERQILIIIAKDGLVRVETNDRGPHVTTTLWQFTHADPAEQALYVDAFRKLCTRKLFYPERDGFRLTGCGFQLARKLATQAT